ncbi:MAG: tetratricopeptide repeat protein, partial [Pseudomonadota bacterium]
MKYKLCVLVTSSLLFGCSTFKTAELNKSQLAITPSSNHQLVKANTADLYVTLAERYVENKNYEMAIVAYQKALQLQSNNNRLLTGLATTYAKQNLLSVGIPLLEEVARIEPSAKHFNNLGYAYYLNQQYTEANRVLTQAITLDPGYVQAQKNLALVS